MAFESFVEVVGERRAPRGEDWDDHGPTSWRQRRLPVPSPHYIARVASRWDYNYNYLHRSREGDPSSGFESTAVLVPPSIWVFLRQCLKVRVRTLDYPSI